MMESRQILKALGQVDEKYIWEAEKDSVAEQKGGLSAKLSGRRKKSCLSGKHRVVVCICAVALVVVMIGIGLIKGEGEWHGKTTDPSDVQSVGVTIPPREVKAPAGGATADMIGLFFYQGRCYVQHMYGLSNDDFVGEYIGSVDGSIDEWSLKEEVVDMTGTVRGDVYTVKGMNPEFMLCIWRPGHADLYINDSGYTLVKGEDLYGDRLRLAGNYEKVTCYVDASRNDGMAGSYTLRDEDSELVKQFVKKLYEGDFVWIKHVEPTRATEDERINLYGQKSYGLYFWMENGLRIRIILYEGGYVTFGGLHGVAVQMDPAVAEDMIAVLESGIEKAP